MIGSCTGAKKSNVKRYKPDDFEEKLAAGKVHHLGPVPAVLYSSQEYYLNPVYNPVQ